MNPDEFMHKYRADVRLSNERCHVPEYYPATALSVYNQISTRYKETQYVEIKLTEEAFNYMLTEEARLKKLNALLDHTLLEERIRRSDPRVAKAYDKYKILLSMVENDYD